MKVSIEGHGTIALVRPEDVETREALEEGCPTRAMWWGRALIVELINVQDVLDYLHQLDDWTLEVMP